MDMNRPFRKNKFFFLPIFMQLSRNIQFRANIGRYRTINYPENFMKRRYIQSELFYLDLLIFKQIIFKNELIFIKLLQINVVTLEISSIILNIY